MLFYYIGLIVNFTNHFNIYSPLEEELTPIGELLHLQQKNSDTKLMLSANICFGLIQFRNMVILLHPVPQMRMQILHLYLFKSKMSEDIVLEEKAKDPLGSD